MSWLQEHVVVLGLILPGAVLALVAALWLLVNAFRASVWWGLAVLLFPPAVLAFVPLNWKFAKGPMALYLLAGVLVAGGYVAGQFTSVSRDPRVVEVDGELHVTLTRVKVDDYSFLKKYPKVARLHIANEDVTDETLREIDLEKFSELHDLDLSNTKVTDAGLATVAKLPKLKTLNLTNTAVTGAGLLEHLSETPALVKLNVIGCKGIKGKEKRQWEKAGEKFGLKRDVVD